MKKIRNINLDFIKVIACIGVVLLHTTMPGFKETRIWNYSSYLYYLGTYSIPLFFYGQWLFIVREEEYNLFLHTAESKMDSNNRVIMDHYCLVV